jgi:hypothetical protein
MGLLRVAEKKQRANQTLVKHRFFDMRVPNVPKVPAVPDVEEKKARSNKAQSAERKGHRAATSQPSSHRHFTTEGREEPSTAKPQPKESEYLPQRRKACPERRRRGRKENSYPNLALFAPWREESPSLRCFLCEGTHFEFRNSNFFQLRVPRALVVTCVYSLIQQPKLHFANGRAPSISHSFRDCLKTAYR